jgi:hypothetical protein
VGKLVQVYPQIIVSVCLSGVTSLPTDYCFSESELINASNTGVGDRVIVV